MRAIALLAVLIAAVPVATVSAKSDKPKEAKTCRQTPAINSRLPGRMLCRTAKEWEREDYNLQRGTGFLEGKSINRQDVGAMPSMGGPR